MNSLQAVFWDLDGTIADTELDGHRVAFNIAFKEHNLEWYWDRSTYIDLLMIHGSANRLKQYALKSGVNLTNNSIEKIKSIKTKHYIKLIYSGKLKLRIGVKRLIDELHENNIKQWIVTSSGRDSLTPFLDKFFGNEKFKFQGYITADDVKCTKPDPTCYLKALNGSRISPSNCLAIEDSLPGLIAANKAGISCLITLTDWCMSNTTDFDSAVAIVGDIGNNENNVSVYKGITPPQGIVDLKYLSSLLSTQ